MQTSADYVRKRAPIDGVHWIFLANHIDSGILRPDPYQKEICGDGVTTQANFLRSVRKFSDAFAVYFRRR
jgi:hypothetical protein